MEPDSKWVWSGALAGVVVVAAIGVAAWWYGERRPTPVAEAALPAAAPAAANVPASAAEPEMHYPLDIASAAAGGPTSAMATTAIDAMLADTFGAGSRALFQTNGFARRFVATVDNLGRTHASPMVWPMVPAAGRFGVDGGASGERIAAANAARYEPYVALLERADAASLAALYKRLYPELQAAYEELGFPGKYFNDRLVRVLDLLLATPEIDAPAVRLPNAGTGAQPARPWLVYEYQDPALQALSAGQKTLLRMGVANERRVKAKLAEFRRLVTAGAVAR